MKKTEKNNRHKTSTSTPLPFEKFRKKAPVNAVLSEAAARAAKAQKRLIKQAEQEKFKQSKHTGRKRLHVSEVPQESTESNMRLNKFLAHAGVASRRKADELIKAGRVTVNGKVVFEMGFRLQEGDKVCFDGKLLTAEPKVYVLLNKPKDYITTVHDERNRKTVMDLVKGVNERLKHAKKVRLYPVGRLDRNTTGVLLLTNDGEMAQRLIHPSSEIKKVYHVFLDKKLKPSDFEKIAAGGVVLEDGIAEVDQIAMPNPKNKAEVGIEIHSGKNRIVRRIFQALGYEVVKLDRVSFAGLTKKDLPRGRWRFLTEEEIRMLRYFTKGVIKHLPTSHQHASKNS